MPKEIRQPEQKLNSEPQPIDTTSCPNIGNTNVVCSQSLPMLVIDGLEIFSGVKIDERLFALKIKTIGLDFQ